MKNITRLSSLIMMDLGKISTFDYYFINLVLVQAQAETGGQDTEWGSIMVFDPQPDMLIIFL